jgi:hypothetical protein
MTMSETLAPAEILRGSLFHPDPTSGFIDLRGDCLSAFVCRGRARHTLRPD